MGGQEGEESIIEH